MNSASPAPTPADQIIAAALIIKRNTGIDVRPPFQVVQQEQTGALSPAERHFAASRMPLNDDAEHAKRQPLTDLEIALVEAATHIECLVKLLDMSKIAYRVDAKQICVATQAASDLHNRILGLGQYRGKGLVRP